MEGKFDVSFLLSSKGVICPFINNVNISNRESFPGLIAFSHKLWLMKDFGARYSIDPIAMDDLEIQPSELVLHETVQRSLATSIVVQADFLSSYPKTREKRAP